MTAADKIAEARALIGFANRMSYVALRVGLEGTAEWDQISGAVDIYHVQDTVAALTDLADAQAQEIARLKAADVSDDASALTQDILAELTRARQKFPGKNVTFAALVEEVGELATAIFEESAERVRKEAVQVAVMAMRVILDGDHAYEPWRAEKGLDPLCSQARAALGETP